MSRTEIAARIGLALAVIAGASWLWLRNYGECRSHGFTVVYCLMRGR